ncbi:MAG: ABC transporter permease subunit [Actinomycetota bacterium]|nr:ABC transporter permease subunit [Actinomycetota bacterium]
MSSIAPAFVSTVQPDHRPGIAAVARSEWTKIRSLRSTFWTLFVTAGLTIGLGALFALGRTSGRDPIPPNFNAAGFPLNAMFLSQLAIGVLGVLVVTAEYTSGMIRTTFTAVPQRGLVLAVKASVFALVTVAVATVTTFVTFFISQAILNRDTRHLGVSLTSPNALRIVVGAALYLTLCGLLGVALGALLRSTPAAITTLAGLLFILPILMNFLPTSWHRDDIARWLPSNAGFQIIENTPQPLQFTPWVGLAVLAGWVAVAMAAALVLLHRRDV